ncbi:MAG: hypothetical protein IJZ87_03320 [Bacteroidales bacterium]|nr:hypothetical protein [Bacteroidales bacterium]
MNKYLSDFIGNMKKPSRENTTLSLDEAEWHLTACLNYQLCNANTSKLNMYYDTIVTGISVVNNEVAMSEINSSFQEITKEVNLIYDAYDIENKQIVFIHSVIDAENLSRGESTITTIMATTSRNNNHYYFDDWEYICLDTLFPSNAYYNWRDAAVILSNYVVSFGTENLNNDYYYVSIGNRTFNYTDYPITDLYSDYPYRLYVCSHCIQDTEYHLSDDDMKFYLDSYLGLAKIGIQPGALIDANVRAVSEVYAKYEFGPYLLYHTLHAYYGTPVLDENDNVLD